MWYPLLSVYDVILGDISGNNDIISINTHITVQYTVVC